MSAAPAVYLEPRSGGGALADRTLAERFHHGAAGWLLGYSTNTRDAYRRDLDEWLGWLRVVRVEPWTVERGHVDAYARTLEEHGYAPATIGRRLASLSSLYGYLVDEDPDLVDGRNPAARARRPKVSKDSPTLGLDRQEAAEFLDAAATDLLDHAVACLLMLNGLRVSEACGLDVQDLAVDQGHRVLTVRGKGGRVDVAPLAPRTAAALDAYLDGRQVGPLLLDRAGADRLDRHDAARIVARVARAAGIRKRISPHSLRHTMVTQALRAGVPLHVVQDAARHADPRTTRRYDRAARGLDEHATYALSAFLAGGASS